MGWFSSSTSITVATAPAAEVSVAGASDQTVSQSAPQHKPVVAAAAPPALTEAEQLDLLVAGARLDDVEAQDTARFLSSNTRHTYLDGLLSCAVYTFSGLQHVHGQSNALTLLTMWTVGTTFLVDVAERTYVQNAVQGTLPAAKGSTTPATGSHDGTASSAAAEAEATFAAATAPSLTTALVDRAALAEQQRKIFLTQTVASWVWMLASLQQFKVHKRLKWCGYSSWMGLGCAGYYTTRHLYNMLVK